MFEGGIALLDFMLQLLQLVVKALCCDAIVGLERSPRIGKIMFDNNFSKYACQIFSVAMKSVFLQCFDCILVKTFILDDVFELLIKRFRLMRFTVV